MPKTSSPRKASLRPNTPPIKRKVIKRLAPGTQFCVVHRGEVVFQSVRLLESTAVHHRLRGSVVCSIVVGNVGKTEKAETPKPNPLSDVFDTLSLAIEEDVIERVVDFVGSTGSMDHGCSNYGWTRIPGPDHKLRPATNSECAFWAVDLTLTGRFDRRKKLPAEAAKWLRVQAARLIGAANAMKSINDDRNRAAIRKLIEDESYLPSIVAQGFEFHPDGTLMTHEEYEKRAAAEEGGAV